MIVRVNNKGQITIPAKLRKQFGIKAGTRIVIVNNGNSISLKPITENYVQALRGSFKGKGLLKAYLAEKQRDREVFE
ncbi:hypothetical protein ANRL2_03182 [Anaerolineae bacterium]|nr:hypothetical protein ANRL2_03182 [Anaerolineae bacterium]